MKKELIWIVTGTSESGDTVTPVPFKHDPTEDELKDIIADMGEDLDAGGPGDFGSYVKLETFETLLNP